MANLPISGLTASAANAAATDVLPVVQTTGVGPVKMTIQQVIAGILGSTSINGATETTSKPLLDLTQTWNAGAVSFTGLKANFTDTASAAGSLLMDLQVGGASQLSVRKDGRVFLAGNASAGFAKQVASNYVEAVTGFSAALGASNGCAIQSGGVTIGPTGTFSFTNSNGQGSSDTILRRRAVSNFQLGPADAGAVSATVTITIASPGVITWTNHLLSTGTPVVFTTTGALPTGITAGTTYYVIEVGASTFQIATSFANALAGTAINTSGSQSGTHTGTRNAIVQRVSAQSVTGVTDRPGADFLIQGSQGTGTGAGGSIIVQVAPAGSSNTAQNALATALTIDANRRLDTPVGLINSTLGSSAPWFIIDTSATFKFQLNGFERGTISTTNSTLANGLCLHFATLNLQTATGTTTVGALLSADAANTLALRNGTNAQEQRVYGSFTSATNFQRMSIKTLRESSGALSGATYVSTIAIPAYAVPIGVTTRVTTAITGATSYDVGDGTDADLWGNDIDITLGSQSRTADFTAIAAVDAAATARTVTLTANGSNFTGGVVEICVHYLTTEAD